MDSVVFSRQDISRMIALIATTFSEDAIKMLVPEFQSVVHKAKAATRNSSDGTSRVSWRLEH